jgi:hypothetical protein
MWLQVFGARRLSTCCGSSRLICIRPNVGSTMRQGLLNRNVAALTRPLRLDEVRESVILTPEQVRSLLALAEGHRDGPLWVVRLRQGHGSRNCLGSAGPTSIST